jgi:GntR family transcriptional repressor for pyruvate dehydrogenase complex
MSSDKPSATGFNGASRVETVYKGILELIKDNDLQAGDRLPSEAKIAEQFAISRPVVRQSLVRLQEAGVIQIRWGSGSYVCDSADWRVKAVLNSGPIDSVEGIRHTFEIRMAIESEGAAFAAQRATAADRAAIKAAHERYVDAKAGKQQDSGEADLNFHFLIAKAARNPFFTKMMLDVRESVRFCARIGMLLAHSNPDERLRRICQEHEDILNAIVDGDPDRAREVMRRHVSNAYSRVFQGLTPEAAMGVEPEKANSDIQTAAE